MATIDFDDDDNVFAQKAREVIAWAEGVDCSMADFLEGLRVMAGTLEERAELG